MITSGCGKQAGIEIIRSKLTQIENIPHREVDKTAYISASVLVPLVCQEDQWYILFTKRSDFLPTHKGQVSFPGGAKEDKDQSLVETALRETFEEIGIKPEDVDVLGFLRNFPTITGYIISPVVGVVPWPYPIRQAEEEVSRVFLVPLQWLAESAHQEEVELSFANGWTEKVVYFQNYDNEKIWGATARITVDLLNALNSNPK